MSVFCTDGFRLEVEPPVSLRSMLPHPVSMITADKMVAATFPSVNTYRSLHVHVGHQD